MRSVTAGTRCNVPPHRHRWLSPLIVSLGVAAGPLDTAVNIAFPAITAAFGIPVTTIQWVVICYVLTYGSLLLGCGRLGDVIGHKRVFLFGLGWSCHQLIPVWLGSHVRLVTLFPHYAGRRYGPPVELCASPCHSGVSRSRAWHSSGRVYHALGARLDARTVAGRSVRSTLGLASRILFSRAAGPHRRCLDGILGATAGGRASRTAFR